MDYRGLFLDYFAKKNHQVYDSAPLVPDDPTLLFTNAGMVAFKDIFTGKIPTPSNKKATSAQLCIRAGGKHNDLENVGYTNRHHTLFEMLGNFSFGDYFKEEAIAYAWEFVTKELEFHRDKLYVSIHNSDDESFEIWKKHIKEDRIKRFGDKDNFWQMGESGACGPCSEIFVDQGEKEFNSKEDYFGGEGDRFLEIWNLVFMQYERDISGELKPLPKPSIDTGMGLERVVALKEGVYTNFHSSLFMPLILELQEILGQKYEGKNMPSFRVIVDHIRSIVFLISQGVTFDKEGRGYVLRRILRRALRHGYLLGAKEPFLYRLTDALILVMGSAYSYLIQKSQNIKELIEQEEERFFSTIFGGMEIFKKELERSSKIFSGEAAFKLYDTYGFPLDLTEDMLKDSGIKIDVSEFDRCMSEQRNRSKASWRGSGDDLVSGDFMGLLEKYGKNSFVGYERLSQTSTLLALLDENFKIVEHLDGGSIGYLLLDKTPFYAKSGGQCGDIGAILRDKKVVAEVLDSELYFGLNLSKVKALESISSSKEYECKVDRGREEIAKHHSATHLLHAALREVLGDHVSQAGSLVERDRLRFDFTHPKPLSQEECEKIEEIVNSKIFENRDVKIEQMDIESAKNRGAMALFGEKYGDVVRVVDFGDFSVELCGGTHVKNSSLIGIFLIQKESGVSSGVRRVEAICGEAAYKEIKKERALLKSAYSVFKNQDLLGSIEKQKEQIKSLKSEIQNSLKSQKSELATKEIGDVKVVIDRADSGDVKTLIDDIKNRFPKVAIMLFQIKDEKVVIAAGSKGSAIKAGAWVKEIAPILGGGGGGRDDFAQAGGRDISKIDEALKRSLEYIEEKLA